MARTKGKKVKGKKGKKKKSRVISVDMEGVESGSRVSDGDYKLTVEEVEVKEGEESGKEYLNFIFKVEGGGKVYHICSLQPQALFNLRSTLEALEVDVPDSAMDVDLDDLEGLECGGTIANEVYQGKKSPKLVDIFTLEELDEDNTPDTSGNGDGDSMEVDDIEVDTTIRFEYEDETIEGEVEKVNKNKITIDGEDYKKKDIEDLVLVEEEEEEEKTKKKSKKKDKKSKKKGKKKKSSIDIDDEVKFDDDGETIEGKVTDIDDDIVTIEDSDGDSWEVEITEVELAD